MALSSRNWLFLAVGLAVGAAYVAYTRSPGVPSQIGDLDRSGREAWLHPDSVTVYHIDSNGQRWNPHSGIPEQFLANPALATPDWVARMKKWLESQKDEPKMCEIQPGFVVRCTKGGRSYDCALCFHCGQWSVFAKGDKLGHVHDFVNAPVGWALLHEIYPKMSEDVIEGYGDQLVAPPPKTGELQNGK